jgi:hypothetical protein
MAGLPEPSSQRHIKALHGSKARKHPKSLGPSLVLHERVKTGVNVNTAAGCVLTRAHLQAWAGEADLADDERIDRQTVSRRILTAACNASSNKGWSRLKRALTLADGLTIASSLDLKNLKALRTLPTGLCVEGDLFLSGCTNLCHLPEELNAGGDLYLSGCTLLTRLPDSIRINGSLYADECISLTQLPRSLATTGSIDLTGCANLSQLPAGLCVGASLYLNGCTSLTKLPESLSVGGSLYLTGCTGLTSLPADITTWAKATPGRVRTIELTDSGLSEQTVARLQAVAPQGIHICSNMLANRQASGALKKLADIVAFWQSMHPAARPIDPARWQLTSAECTMMQQFLSRLTNTADYNNVRVRPHLATRICAVIEAITDDASLRLQCLDCITQALESCDDRVSLVLNQLELAIRVHQAEHSAIGSKALHDLLLGLMQLDIVHAHARKTLARLQGSEGIDEIEVFLTYEIALRRVLQLPVVAQTMPVARCAEVTRFDLESAYTAARDAASDPAQVAAYLAASSPWQHHLRRQAAAAWSWDGLLPKLYVNTSVLQALRCPLTLEPYSALVQPLVWQQGAVCVAYEAAAFLKHWVAHGFEPTTRRRVALEEMLRPQSV